MRSRRPVVASLVALTAGLAASAVLRRITARRRSPVVAPAAPVFAPAAPAAERQAVVLNFTPRPAPAPKQPVRCGDTGGRTKAGAPCAARATSNGRCHHHRVAA
jgi:hypothetical protein